MDMLLTPVPDNLRTTARKPTHYVTGDLYSIAERIKEIGRNLVIVFHEGREHPFVIMEECDDGVSRFVKRYKELDSRVLDDLRYMLAVPFEKRMAKVEAEEKANNDALEKTDEGLVEWVASEMRRDLKKTNFIDPIGETLYPLNPTKTAPGRKGDNMAKKGTRKGSRGGRGC